jgi:hypothetical protein
MPASKWSGQNRRYKRGDAFSGKLKHTQLSARGEKNESMTMASSNSLVLEMTSCSKAHIELSGEFEPFWKWRATCRLGYDKPIDIRNPFQSNLYSRGYITEKF